VSKLADEIKRESGVDLARCFQCRKCSNGCPVSDYLDLAPSRMIRLILLDRRDEVLRSKTIWTCASCYTCSTRCPNDIDFARVADALRQIAVREGVPAALKRVKVFHEQFLADVKRRGRVHEATLMPLYKLHANDLTSDMDLGMAMFFKGKLPLLPHGVKDKKAVRAAFKPRKSKGARS
jgi:heterodisulfide reductase subunit C